MPDRAAASVTLGFDYGSRRVGLAVGNAITGNANALATIEHRDGQPDWPRLAAIVAEWRPGALIVGLPLDNDGSNQKMTRRARGFMAGLAERFGLPVHGVDERFSTIEAVQRLRGARHSGSRGKRVAKGDSDAMAAQVILESWLNGEITETETR